MLVFKWYLNTTDKLLMSIYYCYLVFIYLSICLLTPCSCYCGGRKTLKVDLPQVDWAMSKTVRKFYLERVFDVSRNKSVITCTLNQIPKDPVKDERTMTIQRVLDQERQFYKVSVLSDYKDVMITNNYNLLGVQLCVEY